MTDQTPETEPDVAPEPCTHPLRPQPVADAPDWTCACGTVFVTATIRMPAVVPEPVVLERPAPLRWVRCADDDGEHPGHNWDAPLGNRGDVATVWCTGDPLPTDGADTID